VFVLRSSFTHVNESWDPKPHTDCNSKKSTNIRHDLYYQLQNMNLCGFVRECVCGFVREIVRGFVVRDDLYY